MGGGRRSLLPNNFTDPEAGWIVSGRKDNRNLIQEWIDQKTAENAKFQYVWNLTSFEAVNPDTTDYLMGLFEPNHMQYEAERLKDKAGEPSLAQMTKKAIQILSKNPKGFFLLVEGGRIDHAHHEGNAANALHDTWPSPRPCRRHETCLTSPTPSSSPQPTIRMSSHSQATPNEATTSLLVPGLVKTDGLSLAKDNKTYTTLVYGNGPGYLEGPRPNLTQEDATNLLYKQQSAVPISSETHGGEDVAIYAHGAMAHLFHGVHEQHYIPHVMAYASCVGDYADDNDCAASLLTPSTPSTPTTSGVSSSAVSLLVILGQTLATVILKYLC
ncbi:hypothetical protein C0Q70_02521 [Pomacea canaliculata]|uniref:Alkaline phosphatase, tissue-nonspecific isozyme n=1 Tax=Pomacea canaliculata TaxID=400727 RepID=A0A2T7PQ62_POMCA|nr:hypothetical protein C0Q70_02521 [Pomacea canaliculata]